MSDDKVNNGYKKTTISTQSTTYTYGLGVVGVVGLGVVGFDQPPCGLGVGFDQPPCGLGAGFDPPSHDDDDDDQVQIVGDEVDSDEGDEVDSDEVDHEPEEDGPHPEDDPPLLPDLPDLPLDDEEPPEWDPGFELGAPHHSILFRLRLLLAPPRSLDEDGSSANNNIRRPPDLPDLPLEEELSTE